MLHGTCRQAAGEIKNFKRGLSIKHLDLFSGIGGFALAAKWAGFETVGFCEIEEYPRQVLAKNFPGVPIHNDIRELNVEEYKGIELITGGYPCQPFSNAGSRKGDKDHRHLWPQMLRIIKQARPTWIVAENVAGHITMGLDKVLSDLEIQGYAARPLVVPACAIDAPHRRDRVWIVANASSGRRGSKSRREVEQPRRTEAISSSEAMADPESSHDRGHDRGRDQGATTGQGTEPRTSSGRVWRPWPPEPGVGRVVAGVRDRVDRIRALGNAIVPQVAYKILMSIKETINV